MQSGTALFIAAIAFGISVAVFHFMKGAGPDRMWRLGANDPVRNVLFRKDGSWRKYGKISIAAAISTMILISLLGI